MKLQRIFLPSLAVVMLLTVGAVAREHRTGALREPERPAWVIPSPFIQLLDQGRELDQSCDNSDGLPPVGNQAAQGSCTAWATGYYYLTYTQGQDYGWDLSDPAHQCSPAFTYNQINGGHDGGSYPTDAFLLFKTMGCGTLADMPYSDNNCTDMPSEEAYLSGMRFRTDNIYSINTHTNSGLQSLKNHLLNGNIAATAITVWNNFDNISNFGYIYCVNDVYGNNPGGHAVTVVGFDDDLETADGTGAFRMVNSWGSNWGDDGFFWMSYEAFLNQIIGWGEAWYADDREGYQPSMVARVQLQHGDRYSLRYEIGIGQVGSPLDMQIYNDFYAGSYANIPFPQSAIVFDISDLTGLINDDTPNPFFIRISDTDPWDGYNGTINDFTLEDLDRGFYAQSQDVPGAIPDNNIPGDASAVLYYAVRPPVDFTAAVDLSQGVAQLSWEAPELDDFVAYVVYRDGLEIGTSTDNYYNDLLPDFGVYSYSVASRWDETTSWRTDEMEINYVEPVAPSYTSMYSVESGTGQFTLGWQQLRNLPVQYDDGSAESRIYPDQEALPGTMIAQRFSVPDAGRVLRVGAWFLSQDVSPAGNVRLVLLRDGGNGLPGEVFYQCEPFMPDGGWYWLDLNGNGQQLELDEADDFWVAVCWEDLNCSYLGRDINGEQFDRKALSLGGGPWVSMTSVGNPMIRALFGTEERVGDWTGLESFDIHMNDEWLGSAADDQHTFNGVLPEPGTYTFRVDADYQQGVWQGEPMIFEWNGDNVQVRDLEEGLPTVFRIGNPYPNPFNPVMMIDVELPEASLLKVDVFNLLGRQVAVIADGSYEAGTHKITFRASGLASGVYLLRADVPGKIHEVRKVILMR